MNYPSDVLKKLEQLNQEKKYMELMAFIAEYNGGELISKQYTRYNDEYEFFLKKGDLSTRFFRKFCAFFKSKNFQYAFPQSIENMKRKNESKVEKFLQFKKKVEDLGGILLEEKWLGCSVKHKIKLFEEDISLTPKEVNRSGLASSSRGLVTEPILRQTLEHIFGYKFNKTRNVLTKKITKTKSNLELDGYCAELNIAFEYQGHPSHWDEKDPRFQKTKIHDELKIKLCKELNIALLQFEKIKHKNFTDKDFYLNIVRNKIKDVFVSENKPIPNLNIKNFNINLAKTNHYHQCLENLKTAAHQNGYELMDEVWKGASYLYRFKHVDSGIEIKLTSLHVNKVERGLPKDIMKHIQNKQQKDKSFQLEKFKKIIEANGFTLVSDKWENAQLSQKIKHNITNDIIEVKPQNVLYSQYYIKNKFNELLKNMDNICR